VREVLPGLLPVELGGGLGVPVRVDLGKVSTVTQFPIPKITQLAMRTKELTPWRPLGERRRGLGPAAPGVSGRPINSQSFGLVRTVQGGRRLARSAAEGALDRPDQPHTQQSGGPSPAAPRWGIA
jgi:hypothetical protein